MVHTQYGLVGQKLMHVQQSSEHNSQIEAISILQLYTVTVTSAGCCGWLWLKRSGVLTSDILLPEFNKLLLLLLLNENHFTLLLL